MTREEAIKILRCEADGDAAEALEIVLRAAEEQPCEEKTFLKKRTKDYVTYNVEWLKEHFDMEREILLGKAQPCEEPCDDVIAIDFSTDIDKPGKYQTKDNVWHEGMIPTKQPCEDAVSREDVKNGMTKYGFHAPDMTVTEFVEDELPSVTPKVQQPCDDAVSRNNVITSICQYGTAYEKAGKYVLLACTMKQELADLIQSLPSVQPTAKENLAVDAVSRTEVLRYLERTYHSGMGKKKSYEYNMKFISMMPRAMEGEQND